jgi:mannitol/fructose-specific phosphotransferase system IIA component (Ntr-type)
MLKDMRSTVPSVLVPERIDLDLRATSEADAINNVAELLRDDQRVIDFDGFCRELFTREKLSPTALGNGVAFPHARTGSVSELVVAIGRSKEGIWFEKCPDKVHFVFVIGTPKDSIREYLALLATLAMRLRQRAVREELMKTETPEEFLQTLNTQP